MTRTKKPTIVNLEQELGIMQNVETAPEALPETSIIQIDSAWTPPAKARKGRAEKYPCSELKPGQSFFVADKTAAAMYGTVYSASKRTGFALSAHDVDGGCRVYRSADLVEGGTK